MNEDFSEVISKFKTILEEKNIEMPSMQSNTNNSSEKSTGFDIDIATILKIKNMIGTAQEKNSPRVQLLNALKPFLTENYQQRNLEWSKST